MSALIPLSSVRLILGSTSKYRRALLEPLGWTFESMATPFDEEAAKPGLAHLPVGERALHLARGKALAVSALHPDAWVIGGDQIAEVDGETLSKPRTAELARAQLARLAGRTHRLHTAVVLSHGASGRVESALDVHALTMRPLDAAAIARYVERDQPLDCAGSYRIEASGIALFASVAGEDHTAVVGLPVTRLVGLMLAAGLNPW